MQGDIRAVIGTQVRQRAREAVARCLADVEDYPEAERYALADDVLLALTNAGLSLTEQPLSALRKCDENHTAPEDGSGGGM